MRPRNLEYGVIPMTQLRRIDQFLRPGKRLAERRSMPRRGRRKNVLEQ